MSGVFEKATPRPWAYRPCEHDDWGFIRGPETQLTYGVGRPVVALARSGAVDYDADDHRRNKTDPYGPNAELIIHAVNNIEALQAERDRLREALENIEGECTTLNRTNFVGMHSASVHSVTFRTMLKIGEEARSALNPHEGEKG